MKVTFKNAEWDVETIEDRIVTFTNGETTQINAKSEKELRALLNKVPVKKARKSPKKKA